MYDALMLKICFRVSANVVRTPATCRHGHISAFECVYVSRAEYLEYTMLSSLFCLFPAPREEREVSNVLSSLWFHLHSGVLFVHMQICLNYNIITLDTPFPQRSGLVPSYKPQPTGDVTDPCSSPFMLVQNSRDVHLIYIAAIAAIVCILHSFAHAIKYQD